MRAQVLFLSLLFSKKWKRKKKILMLRSPPPPAGVKVTFRPFQFAHTTWNLRPKSYFWPPPKVEVTRGCRKLAKIKIFIFENFYKYFFWSQSFSHAGWNMCGTKHKYQSYHLVSSFSLSHCTFSIWGWNYEFSLILTFFLLWEDKKSRQSVNKYRKKFHSQTQNPGPQKW